MAFALLVRGGRGAPLSTEFGRRVRYGWMALRLSTLRICRPQKSQCRNNALEGHNRHPVICRMNLIPTASRFSILTLQRPTPLPLLFCRGSCTTKNAPLVSQCIQCSPARHYSLVQRNIIGIDDVSAVCIFNEF